MNARLIEGRKKYLEKLKKGEIVKAKKPSLKKAVLAKCKDCMSEYEDGREDCGIERCSLYTWMPYGKFRKKHKKEVDNELF